MTLKETIKKILKEEHQSNFVRRRHRLLGSYIKSAYNWLDPTRFGNFGEFLERVIFSTTRDFTADNYSGDYESMIRLIDKIQPEIKEIVLSDYRDEIYEYFMKNY